MKSSAPAEPLLVNGWTLFAHPLFLAQVGSLERQVEKLRQKHPKDFRQKNASKRLQAVLALALEDIPQDPTRAEYRQGNALGPEYRHWFRAKFFQQYRLFFRYHLASKIIVYAWVNDEDTKRAYESADDAYRVFRKLLSTGHPPDDWDALLAEAKREHSRLRIPG